MARAPAVEVHARNPAIRAGLRDLLARAGVEVVDEGRSPGGPSAEPFARLRGDLGTSVSDIDVLVVDIGGSADSYDGQALAAESEGFPTLFLVDALPPEALASPSTPAMPRGWLRRDASEEELAAAVRAIAAGLQVIDPTLELQARARGSFAELTEREREVLALIALGLTNRAIALELGISEHTAKFHVGAVLAKLAAQSRAEAVSVAVREGLLTL